MSGFAYLAFARLSISLAEWPSLTERFSPLGFCPYGHSLFRPLGVAQMSALPFGLSRWGLAR